MSRRYSNDKKEFVFGHPLCVLSSVPFDRRPLSHISDSLRPFLSGFSTYHCTTLILFSHLAQTWDYTALFIIIISLHCTNVCQYSWPSFPFHKHTLELTLCSNIAQSWATVKVWQKEQPFSIYIDLLCGVSPCFQIYFQWTVPRGHLNCNYASRY